MSEWQFIFTVKGLDLPKEPIKHGDIEISNTTENQVIISIKIPKEIVYKNSSISSELMEMVNEVLCIYGLITNNFSEITSSSHRQIGGNIINFKLNALLSTQVTSEQRIANADNIKKALTYYDKLKQKLKRNKYYFLRNALDYYTRSLNDEALEEKMLDLMICIEAIFNSGEAEINSDIR